jgi:hypothetical protein
MVGEGGQAGREEQTPEGQAGHERNLQNQQKRGCLVRSLMLKNL